MRIPLFKPQNYVEESVVKGLVDVIKSGWYTLGPNTEQFEKEFSNYVMCKYGVALNSCTAALYLALDGLNVEASDTVIVPAMTFVATANVVKWRGARVVFCDVKDDGNIDPEDLARIIEQSKSIKAVIIVHLYSLACDVEKILRLCKQNDVCLIEDCAHAIGATFKDNKVGSFGQAGCFSFYATKNLATGEGGMLTTDDMNIFEHVRHVRNHCQTKTPAQKMAEWSYDVDDLGFNFRMSEFQAVIGLAQIPNLEKTIEARRELAKRYEEELENIPGLSMLQPPSRYAERRHVYHLLVVKVEKEYPLNRDKLYLHLRRNNIICGVHYIPIHFFTYYKKIGNYKVGDFPVAEELFSKVISLPMYPYMSEEEFRYLTKALKDPLS